MEVISRVHVLKSVSVFLLVALLVFSSVSCVTTRPKAASDNPSNPLSNILGKIFGKSSGEAKFEYIEGVGEVMLTLTYPVGQSPKVFTQGWLFGASCIINQGKADQKDISDQVKWSGSGTFTPAIGKTSRPLFAKAGSNSIVLSVSFSDKKVTQEYTVNAVSPVKYARINNYSLCPSDAHGCPNCPHIAQGPITTGSPTVLIDNFPAARVGDTGIHQMCCGPNTFEIVEGDPDVLIDGRRAARLGDRTKHCGGTGKIVMGYGSDFGTVRSDGKTWVLKETMVNPPGGHQSSKTDYGGTITIDYSLDSFVYTRSQPGQPARRDNMTWTPIPATPPWSETHKFEFTRLPDKLVPGKDVTITVTGHVTISGDAPGRQASLRIEAGEHDSLTKTGRNLWQGGGDRWELLVSAGKGPVTKSFSFSVPVNVTATKTIDIRIESYWGSIYLQYVPSK